jgi:hypothetical protein
MGQAIDSKELQIFTLYPLEEGAVDICSYYWHSLHHKVVLLMQLHVHV